MSIITPYRSFCLRAALVVVAITTGRIVSAQTADSAAMTVPGVPDTPVGRLFTRFFSAFNTLEPAQIKTYIEKYWPGDQTLTDKLVDRAKQTGGYDFRGFTESTNEHLLAIVQAKTGSRAYFKISFNCAANDPNRMTRLLFAASSAAEVPPPKLTAADLEAAKTGTPYRQFSSWLEAFNSGDKARIQKFLDASWPTGSLTGQTGLLDRTGGYDLLTIEHATSTMLVGTMKERRSTRVSRFTLTIEPDAPHKIVRFGMAPVEKQ